MIFLPFQSKMIHVHFRSICSRKNCLNFKFHTASRVMMLKDLNLLYVHAAPRLQIISRKIPASMSCGSPIPTEHGMCFSQNLISFHTSAWYILHFLFSLYLYSSMYLRGEWKRIRIVFTPLCSTCERGILHVLCILSVCATHTSFT